MGSRKNKKHILQSLLSIAEKNKCILTKYELCGNSIIGIDENTKTVFFFKQLDGEEVARQINLSEIKNCDIIKSRKPVRNKKSSFQEIEKLKLCFTPINSNKQSGNLEFYNYDEDTSLGGELQLVERWAKIINKQLIPNKTKRNAMKHQERQTLETVL